MLSSGQAYRLALMAGQQTNVNVTDVADHAEQFKQRMNGLMSANQGTLIAGAVVLTATAMYGGYKAMMWRLDRVDDEREGFQDMVEQGISTYFIAKAHEKRTGSDHYLNAFVTDLQKPKNKEISELLFLYSGIHKKDIDHEKSKGIGYFVMSTFAFPMGAFIEKVEEDGDTIDEACQSLNSFLKSDVVNLLTMVTKGLNNDLLTKLELFIQAQKSLKQINAVRFLVISLGNIVLNLMRPMDPKTNMPVSLEDSVVLCALFRQILGDMLSEVKTNDFTINRTALRCNKRFNGFLKTLDDRVLVLQGAYEASLKHQLNLNDITNSAHALVQNIVRSILPLINLNQQSSAPEHLISKMIGLNCLIDGHPDLVMELVKQLNRDKKLSLTTMPINHPPVTVIDALAAFGSMNASVRRAALKHFKQNTVWSEQFVVELRDFDKHFILPIENRVATSGFFSYLFSHTSAFNASTSYLICSIALVLETFNVNLTTNPLHSGMNVNKQVRLINKQILSEHPIFTWELFKSSLGLKQETLNLLMSVMLAQYKMLPTMKQADWMATLVRLNQSYLFRSNFQPFLATRLRDLNAKQKSLVQEVDALVFAAGNDKLSSRDELLVLCNMKNDDSQTSLSVPEISASVDAHVNKTVNIIEKSVFDDEAEQTELFLIQAIKAVDNPNFFASQDEFDGFYRNLESGLKPDNVVGSLSSITTAVSDASACPSLPYEIGEKPSQDIPLPLDETPSYSYQFQAFLAILTGISIGLMIIGTLVMLSMTLGVHYIPIMAAIQASTTSVVMISGFMSAAAGGIGLATSYYFTPKFFKTAPNAQKAMESQTPGVNETLVV
ncbi:MAG: hypothetical protein Q8R24_08440 [Legionellaceae bacterium]|nr:hypothetical protein [Legionellaceae bacterium]